MGKDKFLMVSLKENQAKKLAKVLSNDTCRKILDYLTEKEDATESQIAKDLEMPISTVHYNLSMLKQGGLVTSDSFHYSKKGREVDHYQLANKYIIIAPGSVWGLKEKLKQVLPALTIAGGISVAWYLLKSFSFGSVSKLATEPLLKEAKIAPMAKSGVSAVRVMADQAAPEMANEIMQNTSQHVVSNGSNEFVSHIFPKYFNMINEPLIFFFGAVAAILLYLIWDYFKNK